MRTQIKPLPQINHKPSLNNDEDDSYPGRLHTIQRKLKFGSNTYVKSNSSTATETFSLNKKAKPVNESQILRQIDSKLELHKKDIEQRNDMIITIEKGFETVKQELIREKQINEEKSKQFLELQTVHHVLQLKLKQLQEAPKQNIIINADKEKVASLENTVKQQQQKEQELNKQIEQFKNQLAEMGSKVKGKEDLIEEIKRVKEQMNQQKLKLDQKVIELNQSISKETNEKSQLKKYSDQLKEDVDKQKQSLFDAQTLVKSLEQEKIKLLESLKKGKENNDQISKYQDQLSQLKQQLTDLKQSKDNEITQLKSNIDDQKKNAIELNKQLEDSKALNIEMKKQVKEKSDQLEQFKMQYHKLEGQLCSAQSDVGILQQQIEQLKQQANQTQNLKALSETLSLLEKTDKDIQKNLTCTYCNKFIKQPVTIIPCGHSYCFDCKKGYSKECSKCGPKLKVEAMYRNELLDDIIEMVKLIQQSITTMKTITNK